MTAIMDRRVHQSRKTNDYRKVRSEPTGRVQYLTTRYGIRLAVIYEVGADGEESFSEKEVDELVWHHDGGRPPLSEQKVVRELLSRGQGQAEWIDLDEIVFPTNVEFLNALQKCVVQGRAIHANRRDDDTRRHVSRGEQLIWELRAWLRDQEGLANE